MSETPPPAATPDGADPSMEDILASIRRILNEEEAPAEAAAPDRGPGGRRCTGAGRVHDGVHRRTLAGRDARPSRNPNRRILKVRTAGGTCRTAAVEPRTAPRGDSSLCVRSSSPGGSAAKAPGLDGAGNRRRCHVLGRQSGPRRCRLAAPRKYIPAARRLKTWCAPNCGRC